MYVKFDIKLQKRPFGRWLMKSNKSQVSKDLFDIILNGRVTICDSRTLNPPMKPNKMCHIPKYSGMSKVYQTAGRFCQHLWRFEKSKMASKMAAVFEKSMWMLNTWLREANELFKCYIFGIKHKIYMQQGSRTWTTYIWHTQINFVLQFCIDFE